ncbi:MAG: 3-deoxy-7-phosphoheptulonate synthase [Deltaproteobacteria bacterium]|nr:3-deoxy-7-phosphoheptulonate synthase [Deltaproteobacteria bacterium]
MFHVTDDVRIAGLRPLVPPAILIEDLPITESAEGTVKDARARAANIIHGVDDRLLVVVGPCSVHDPASAIEYGERLHPVSERLSDALVIFMRVYFEKPRTTIGWKGLINDPDIDDSFAINKGLRLARQLLLDLAERGVPAGTEFLDTVIPQFLADLVSWSAIGARTTESQGHRELASGLSMPVGFKNGTDGSIRIAIDAVQAAAHSHHFIGVTKQGIAAIVGTKGNQDCHIILRGAHQGPNFDRESVAAAAKQLTATGLGARVMVDCSHGNSRKDPKNQPAVARAVADQVREGSTHVMGVMLESHLIEGNQPPAPAPGLRFGQSITDSCLGWDDTVATLEGLADATRERRRKSRARTPNPR